MNYLAHLLLAEHSDEGLLGALLGDFVTGSAFEAWPAVVQREILMRRRIDGFTDRHPQVLALKALFQQGQRRFAGIALDVYFDHLLARDWDAHSSQPLEAFSQRVYALLLRRLPGLPPRLQAMAPRMASGDWLGSYRQRENVDLAVSGIARRLARGGEALRACLPILRGHEAEAEAGFAAFFPQLRRFAEVLRPTLTLE